MKKGKENLQYKKVFNKLTIMTAHKYKGRYLYYFCKCECGKQKFILWSHIKSGNTKSCGCLVFVNNGKRLSIGEASKRAAFRTYKTNAEKRNLEFILSYEESIYLMKGNCHYCNSPPSNLWKSRCKTGNFIYNGIDRKNNARGYTINNCVSCCKVCNYFKRDMSYEDFLNLVFRIYQTRALDIEMVSFGELIDKLSTVTIKLFAVCDNKIKMAEHPYNYSKDEMKDNAEKDVELCKQRAKLKGEIDRLLMGKRAIEEVKSYG